MPGFDAALATLPEAQRPAVAGHWQAFRDACARDAVPLPQDPTLLARLARTWACSEFAARTCIRWPTQCQDLLSSGDLSASYSEDGCRTRLESLLETVSDAAALGIALRRFRAREMLRIAWRDLNNLAELPETLADLSRLADACLASALDRLHGWEVERFGEPRGATGQAQRLVVLGMGKLGGLELNYSSDIDLIFAYPEKGETDGRRSRDNGEFFSRLGQQLIKVLNEPTAEGFVFRVDMRLRPFGDSGPLVMSFAALEEYYQNQGRDWERYAMIKVRVVAGDPSDGERLIQALRPFVYRRYLDYGAFESLRDMKAMIAREVERKGLRRNVKLGPGGIREIEFIGQAFQLIYGGREPGLRVRGILQVLDYLADSERLAGYTVRGLKRAYDFLRRTENRLQAWDDRQTHDLPEDPAAKSRLAFAMGYADWSGYVRALLRHTRFVSEQFQQVFAVPQTENGNDPTAADFTAIWRGDSGREQVLELLAAHGYGSSEAALACLDRLRGSFSRRALSKRGQERLDQLMPLVLAAVAGAGQPVVTLERITRLLEAIARRSVYLALLVDNPMALSQLVKLCDASIWIAEYLARYPLLLDELLDPASLYVPLDRPALAAELDQLLDRVPADDEEQVLDVLRHFQHTNLLRVAAADISGAMPLMIVSDHLTEVAEVLLRKVLALAWADVTSRFGKPCYSVDSQTREAGLAIIAYGKLGGIELGYGSDLDLVFLHDSHGADQHTDGPRQLDNATFFLRLVQRIIHMLTIQTASGALYEVDTRLRPSGKSGLLVSSLDAFGEYQRGQAWTWEHQALVRARAVAGSADIKTRFENLRREVLSQPRDVAGLRREVREMRERMRHELGSAEPGRFHLKQDRGGIADIEFMVQYAVLAHARRYPELLTYTDNIRQIDGLEEVGVLSGEDAALLRDAYRDLRRRAHRLTLQDQTSLIPRAEVGDYPQRVMRIWNVLLESDDQGAMEKEL